MATHGTEPEHGTPCAHANVPSRGGTAIAGSHKCHVIAKTSRILDALPLLERHVALSFCLPTLYATSADLFSCVQESHGVVR
jgi:hypothetical protein